VPKRVDNIGPGRTRMAGTLNFSFFVESAP
jgi:hypothetical protein